MLIDHSFYLSREISISILLSFDLFFVIEDTSKMMMMILDFRGDGIRVDDGVNKDISITTDLTGA